MHKLRNIERQIAGALLPTPYPISTQVNHCINETKMKIDTATYQELLDCNHSNAHDFKEKWGGRDDAN